MAVPNDDTEFRYHEHRRHLLFCGTQLIQGRAEFNQTYLKAVVIRTGKKLEKNWKCFGEEIILKMLSWIDRLHDE